MQGKLALEVKSFFCCLSLFVFICTDICSLTTVNSVQDKGSEDAEQEEQSDGDGNLCDILNDATVIDDKLKRLFDIVNGSLQGVDPKSVKFVFVHAIKTIAQIIINHQRQKLDVVRQELDSMALSFDTHKMAFAQLELKIENAIAGEGDDDHPHSWAS